MRWIFLICLLMGACATAEKKTGVLKISFNTEPATLDPRQAGDFASSTLICMIYEGLTRSLPGGEVEPALAERVEISENGKVYTFHLREAFWSDGEPITAYDFEESWKGVLKNPPGLCAYLFYPIKNGERCAKGEASIDEVAIQALDAATLRVELEQPTPYFYSLTAFPSFLAAPQNPDVYSGPFRIANRTHNNRILLEKNQTFWNRKQVFLDAIQIQIIPDENTALQMFEQGDLDWLGGPLSPLPPDALEKWEHQLTFVPSAATTLCTFNTLSFPFHNQNIRKAFSYAIDREEIVNYVVQAGQIPAASMLPPSLTHCSCELSDLEKARIYFTKGLEELGVERLEGLTLYYRSSQTDKRLALALQRQWREALGVEIRLAQLDIKSHTSKLQTKDYQIALSSWIAQFDDPISLLDRFKHQGQLKNYPGWEDAEYQRLLNEAGGSDLRGEFLRQAEQIFADQVPLAPIYHWRSPALCGPRIQRTGHTPSGGILFERFQIR